MKKIMVTGCAGFIGSSLTDKLLSEGKEVIGIDNFNDYYDVKIKEANIFQAQQNPHFKLYRVDIENKEDLEKVFKNEDIESIVHLAARAGVRPSIEHPLEYIKTNILGTGNILELMKQYGIKKLVFASSSSVYGNCQEEKFREDIKVSKPISPYAATKLSCEGLCYTYSHLYQMQVICLRFFTVYGPRQRPDLAINKFSRLIEAGEKIPMYGDGSSMRDYTYIDDILQGIEGAINYNQTNYEIINIGGGSPISLRTMIETLEEVIGKPAQIEELPMQAGDVNKTVSDISKARLLLGYKPSTTFKSGIEQYRKWRKSHVI